MLVTAAQPRVRTVAYPQPWNTTSTLAAATNREYFYDYAGQDPVNNYDLNGECVTVNGRRRCLSDGVHNPRVSYNVVNAVLFDAIRFYDPGGWFNPQYPGDYDPSKSAFGRCVGNVFGSPIKLAEALAKKGFLTSLRRSKSKVWSYLGDFGERADLVGDGVACGQGVAGK